MRPGEAARALVAAEGLTVATRDGETKLHPAVRVQQEAEISLARLIRELDLVSAYGHAQDRLAHRREHAEEQALLEAHGLASGTLQCGGQNVRK